MPELKRYTSLIDCGMGGNKGTKLEVIDPVLENVDFETPDVFHMPVLKVLYQDNKGKFRDIGDVVSYALFKEKESKRVIIVANEDCEDKHLFLEVTFYKEVE